MLRTRNRLSDRLVLGLAALALLSLALLGGRPARADGVTVRVNADLEMSPSGDRKARVEIVWPADTYSAIRKTTPDARKFLQDLAPDRADYEMTDTAARYDDARRAVVLDMTERAAAKNLGGGRWQLEPEDGATLDHMSAEGAPRVKAWFQVKGDWGDGLGYEGELVCTLPPGATEARWDERSKVLSWRLESPAGAGQPRLTADLRARDRVMSTIYKVYGLGSDVSAFWLAKTVFKNEGKGVARNLKVRYQLQNYGSWSPWKKYPEVVPGQTVVSVLYPVLDATIAKLRTDTPANLLLEYSYEDESGRKIEDDDSKKIVILGVNEFVFGNLTAGARFGTWQEDYNNAPLLAAWVTRNDGAVKQFAAMANRMAGGVGAAQSDENALRVMRACYDLLLANDFTYQHPPALRDRSVSFDPKDVQNVKFPRETMRDRSGTCVDLAILYAAMVSAVGLAPRLALVPGHCFPLVTLPSGTVVGVETTGVMGGIRMGSAPFEKVQPYADEEYRKAKADGRIYEIDVHSLWTRGISNPELDELPADILERWGITEEGRRGSTPPARPAGEAPTPSSALDAALGLWGGAIGTKLDAGGVLDRFVVGVDRAGDGYEAATRADVTFTGSDGAHKVVVLTDYRGSAKGDGILFESTKRRRSKDGGPEEELSQAFMLVKPKEGHIEARVGSDADGYTDFTLVRLKREEKPAASEKVRGSWGGEMPHAKLAPNVILDEMYVDVPAGEWSATVRMEITVIVDTQKIPATVLASYTNGTVDGDSVHFEKVVWKRTVPSTGQKTDIDGNPVALHVTAEGKLAGQFEGGDGWPFTLLRRGEAPAPVAPAADEFQDVAASWGGAFGDAKLNDTLLVRDAVVDLSRNTANGVWSATFRATFVVKTANGDVLVKVEGPYPPGRVDGDAVKFPGTSLTRTILSTGAQNPMDGNPLEVRRAPDGRIEARFVGEGGFTLTMMRR